MKLNKIILPITLVAVLGLGSCNNEEDLGVSNIKIEQAELKGLDKWIFDNFVEPLNIEVKYTWDDTELDLNKKLVPPLLNKVEPFLSVVKRVWVEPYMDETIVPDVSFLKKLSPKQIILVGSLSYNSNGTVTLGTAEAGRKIVLYDINEFDKSNKQKVSQMLHTMQHEFAHILHQTNMYSPDFKKVTPSYTSTWANYYEFQAREAGFISAYARSAADEDFAEMIATMLTMSKLEFDNIVDNIGTQEGKSAIRKKEAIIVNYYREKYKINFYDLQKRISDDLNAVVNNGQAQVSNKVNY